MTNSPPARTWINDQTRRAPVLSFIKPFKHGNDLMISEKLTPRKSPVIVVRVASVNIDQYLINGLKSGFSYQIEGKSQLSP